MNEFNKGSEGYQEDKVSWKVRLRSLIEGFRRRRAMMRNVKSQVDEYPTQIFSSREELQEWIKKDKKSLIFTRLVVTNLLHWT